MPLQAPLEKHKGCIPGDVALFKHNFLVGNNSNKWGYVSGHWESLPNLGILLV